MKNKNDYIHLFINLMIEAPLIIWIYFYFDSKWLFYYILVTYISLSFIVRNVKGVPKFIVEHFDIYIDDKPARFILVIWLIVDFFTRF